MPKVIIPKDDICIHRGIHGRWIGRDGKVWSVCNMPLPYLENCINLLELTLNSAYPHKIVGPQGSERRIPYTKEEILQAEDQLRMLNNELLWRLA